jgi:hypothetical protein
MLQHFSVALRRQEDSAGSPSVEADESSQYNPDYNGKMDGEREGERHGEKTTNCNHAAMKAMAPRQEPIRMALVLYRSTDAMIVSLLLAKCTHAYEKHCRKRPPSFLLHMARQVTASSYLPAISLPSFLTQVIPPLSATFDEVYIVSELMDIDMHNLMYLSREKITPDHVQFFIYQVSEGAGG